MNGNQHRPQRTRLLAAIGLLTLATGVLAIPSVASATTAASGSVLWTTQPTASPTLPSTWTRTLTLTQPDARMTLADIKRAAEAASRRSLGPVGPVLVVQGNADDATPASIDQLLTGSDAAGLRLLW